jgi:hypothetical protein
MMQHYQNPYMTAAPQTMDWSAEITPSAAQPGNAMGSMTAMPGQGLSGNQMPSSTLNLKNNLPSEVIESPTTTDEAYRGSMKAMLGRNIGNYIVATFLIGTQGTISWEGVLYEVGNDYIIIYQQSRDRYIVGDIYSLKYVEFYDTRRREMCETILQQNGWKDNN